MRKLAFLFGFALAAFVGSGVANAATATYAFVVPSGSMLPTLPINSVVLVQKTALHRGDIVAFRRVSRDVGTLKSLVQRVIGLPGETISSRGNTVLINGKPLKESWLPRLNSLPASYACSESALYIPTTKIPRGQFFVMGDCRGNSFDSRAWGPVPTGNIIGRVTMVCPASSACRKP